MVACVARWLLGGYNGVARCCYVFALVLLSCCWVLLGGCYSVAIGCKVVARCCYWCCYGVARLLGCCYCVARMLLWCC